MVFCCLMLMKCCSCVFMVAPCYIGRCYICSPCGLYGQGLFRRFLGCFRFAWGTCRLDQGRGHFGGQSASRMAYPIVEARITGIHTPMVLAFRKCADSLFTEKNAGAIIGKE